MNQHKTSAPASPIVRPMAPLVVLLVAVLGLSCQYQPAILISATIPSGVTRLQVFATLDGHSSNEVLDIPVAARSTDGRYSFVLSLPQAATARLLLLRVGGRDSSGCLVATGLGQSELSAKPSDATQLSVSLSPLPAPSGCGDVLPVLLSVSPLTIPVDKETAVSLQLWGTRDLPQISVDGHPVPVRAGSTVDQVSLTAPARPGRPGPALLSVEAAGRAPVRTDAALSYYLPQLRFDAPKSVLNFPGSTTAIEGLVAADLNRDGYPDLVVADDTGLRVALNQRGFVFALQPHIDLGSGSPVSVIKAADA